MNAIAIVAAVMCLFGGTWAQFDVAFSGNPSTAPGILGCPFLTGSTITGRRATVAFQALKAGGVEYTKVLVPEARMSFMDVEPTSFGTLSLANCALAASKNQLDAFSHVDGICTGYNIGEGICPCTDGDFVLYRAPKAKRTITSARASTAPKNRADEIPLPAGYIRKIIYPAYDLTNLPGILNQPGTCEDLFASEVIGGTPALLLNVDNYCYITYVFTDYPCNNCDGAATEVIVKQNINALTMTSLCGQTITPGVFDGVSLAPELFLVSHDGYGCIPYPAPPSAEDCRLTAIKPSESLFLYMIVTAFDIDTQGSCAGDELYLQDGTGPTTVPCITSSDVEEPAAAVSGTASITFHRSPENNQDGSHAGFQVFLAGF